MCDLSNFIPDVSSFSGRTYIFFDIFDFVNTFNCFLVANIDYYSTAILSGTEKPVGNGRVHGSNTLETGFPRHGSA